MPKAKNLKYCRHKQGLTQQQLADAIGTTKKTIIAWEGKKSAIPVPSTKRLAEYFGVDYEEFCDVDLEWLDNSAEDGGVRLTKSEAQNVLLFRKLPENMKNAIRHVIIAASKEDEQ